MRNLKKLLALTLVLALSLSLALPATAAKQIADFSDAAAARQVLDAKQAEMNGSNVYERAVQFMIDLNLMEGSKEGESLNLNLGSDLTRAEFSVMLYKAYHGGRNIQTAGPNFVQMDSVAGDTVGHWAKAYANWAIVTGISAGIGIDANGKVRFGPDRKISFDEALLLCMKAIGLDTDVEETRGFVYPAGVQAIAWQIESSTNGRPMLGSLFATADGLIDRAATALLFEYTIRQWMIGYAPITGERFLYDNTGANIMGLGTIQERTLLRESFGLAENVFTVLTDGDWFGMHGTNALMHLFGADGEFHKVIDSPGFLGPVTPGLLDDDSLPFVVFVSDVRRGGTDFFTLGEGVVVQYAIGWNRRGEATEWSYYYLSAELAETLEIDMYTVGRSFDVVFRTPPTSGTNVNLISQIYGAVNWLDDVVEIEGGVGANFSETIAEEAETDLVFTNSTRVFNNYSEIFGVDGAWTAIEMLELELIANNRCVREAATAPNLADPFPTAGANQITQISHLGRMRNNILEDTNLRIIHNGTEIQYLFIESYAYDTFLGVNDLNNRIEVAHGSVSDGAYNADDRAYFVGAGHRMLFDSPFHMPAFRIGGRDASVVDGGKPALDGYAAANIDRIKDFADFELEREDRFLWFPIRNEGLFINDGNFRTERFAIKKVVEGDIEGLVDRFDSLRHTITLDGNVYTENSAAKVALNPAFSDQLVRSGAEYRLYTFNGRVLEIEEIISPNNYAIVLATKVDGTNSWGDDFKAQVRLFLSDGTTIEYDAEEDYEDLIDELVLWTINGDDEKVLRGRNNNDFGLAFPNAWRTLHIGRSANNNLYTNINFGTLLRGTSEQLPTANPDALFTDNTVFFFKTDDPRDEGLPFEDRRTVWRVFAREDVPMLQGGTVPGTTDQYLQTTFNTFGFRHQMTRAGNEIEAMAVVSNLRDDGGAVNGHLLFPSATSSRQWAISLGDQFVGTRRVDGRLQLGQQVLVNGTTLTTLWQTETAALNNDWIFVSYCSTWAAGESSGNIPGISTTSHDASGTGWVEEAAIDISVRGVIFEYVLRDGLLDAVYKLGANNVSSVNALHTISASGHSPFFWVGDLVGFDQQNRWVLSDRGGANGARTTSYAGETFFRASPTEAGRITLTQARNLNFDDYVVLFSYIGWNTESPAIFFMHKDLFD
jgi:hypothetical protein